MVRIALALATRTVVAFRGRHSGLSFFHTLENRCVKYLIRLMYVCMRNKTWRVVLRLTDSLTVVRIAARNLSPDSLDRCCASMLRSPF